MSKTRIRLVLNSVTHRPQLALSLLMLTTVMSLFVTVLLGAGASYRAAVKAGAEASFGGYAFQITGSSDLIRQTMTDAVGSGAAVAVVKTTGAAFIPEMDRAASGDLVELSGPSGYGILVEGNYPTQPGQVSVSQQVADELDIGLNDDVVLQGDDTDFGTGSYTVTAITINPASTKEASIVGVTRSSTIAERASGWLTNHDYSADAELQQEFGSGNALLGQVDRSVRQSDEEIATRGLSGMPYYEALITIVTVVALTGLIASNRSVYRRTVGALVACGETRRRAWLLALTGSHITIALGLILGLVLGQAVLWFGKDRISGFYEQSWEAIDQSGSIRAATLLGVSLAAVIIASFFLLARKPTRKRTEQLAIPYPLQWSISILGVLVFLFFVWSRISLFILEGHFGVLWTGSFAIPLLFLSVRYLRGHPVQQRAIAMRKTTTYLSLASIFGMCFYTTFYSSNAMIQVNWLRGSIQDVSSYMNVEGLTSNDVDYLSQRFPDLMDEAYVFINPNESQGLLRVIRAEAVPCAQEKIEQRQSFDLCESYAMDQIVIAEPNGKAAELSGQIDPDLASENGEVGIAVIEPATPYLKSVQITSYTDIAPLLESDLMPGMVLEEGSEQAQELGLLPSPIRSICIPNFSSYPDEIKNDFRSIVTSRAGYSFVRESDSPELRQLEAKAITYPTIAGIVSVLLLSVVMASTRQEQRALRQAMYLAGDTSWQRARLSTPLVIPFLGTGIIGTCAGRITSMDHIPLLHEDLTLHDHGIWWSIPLYLIIVAAGGAVLYSSRKPRMEDAS